LPSRRCHLDDLDKVDFVLGNIANHYGGMGGPDKVTIALVIHGPALKAFRAASATPDVTGRPYLALSGWSCSCATGIAYVSVQPAPARQA
jgi:intracellular sulfur oxidation DsrE/DsrF family protein